MKPSLKPVLAIALGGAALSLVSLLIWLDVNDPRQDMVFGQVREVGPEVLILTNRESETLPIRISSTTEIFRGKEKTALSTLTSGDFVQVSFVHGESATKTAAVVRLMRAPKGGNRHE